MSTTPSTVKKRNLLLAVVAMVAAATVGVAVRYSPSKRGASGEGKQSDLCDTKDPESVWSSAERRQCGRIDVRYDETDYTQPCDGASTAYALCIGNELNHSYLLHGGFAGQDCGSPVLVGDFCANSLCDLYELEVTCQDRRLEDAVTYNPVVKEIQGRVIAEVVL